MPQMKLKSSGHKNGKSENQVNAKNSLRSSSQVTKSATANKLDNTLTSPRLRRKLPRNSVKSDSSIISSLEKNDILSHNNLLTAKINNKNNSKFDWNPIKNAVKNKNLQPCLMMDHLQFHLWGVQKGSEKKITNIWNYMSWLYLVALGAAHQYPRQSKNFPQRWSL